MYCSKYTVKNDFENSDYFMKLTSLLQAKDILDELEKWRPAVNEVAKKIVGSTKVHLDGDGKNCRRKECNLGNLISDAMIDYVSQKCTLSPSCDPIV